MIKLQPAMIIRLLEELDVDEAAKHSCLIHHVNGVKYLCLSRTKDFTIKLYIIEEPENPNNGYLVNPHTHRYSFASVLLRGRIEHIRFCGDYFPQRPENSYTMHRYDPETGTLAPSYQVGLMESVEQIYEGDSYWVEEYEIHTLRMIKDRGPVVLGLMQFADVKQTSLLYLKGDVFNKPNTVPVRAVECAMWRDRALQLIGGEIK